MNVWIFQTGEPIHSDRGFPRPMRAINLTNALVEAGHHVTLWSSGFNHLEKKHRSKVFRKITINNFLDIWLIPSYGYSSHIGLKRLIDHAKIAWNLRKILLEITTKPNVAFVGYPPIEFAWVAIKWLSAKKVPVMLDAKDQWPHIFTESTPRFLRPLARVILLPYFWLGQDAMRRATAFCSMSSAFLNWMKNFSGRPLTPMDCVVPLSPMQENFTDEVLKEANDWWRCRGVFDDGRKRFFFVGSVSRAFDFAPIIYAARHAFESGLNWQFVICGNVTKAPRVVEAFSGLSNVIFPGWIDRPKIAALAHLSTFGLAPYKNTDDFNASIPNKVIDYLSLGKPIIGSLGGEVATLLKQYEVGYSYSATDLLGFLNIVNNSCEDPQKIATLSANAIALYDNIFCGEKVYTGLVNRLIELSAFNLNNDQT